MGSVVLLDLMGGVALLLWGLHMVHSGILRAFGPDLRQLLASALRPETIGPTQAMSRVTLKTNPVAVELTGEPNSSGR